MRISTLDECISKGVYLEGTFEPVELAFIRQAVRPGMIAVDVGANIGVHTLTLADCAGSTGMVHAFEPSAAFDRLRMNISLNKFQARTRLNRCAAGAADGTLSLMRCKPGFEAFTSRETPMIGELAVGDRFDVAMRSLDSYSSEHAIRTIDFLKIDAEGSEPEVLRGASHLLANRAIRRIMFEVNETCLANCHSSAANLVQPLRQFGFELRILDQSGGMITCPDHPAGNWTTVIGWLT